MDHTVLPATDHPIQVHTPRL